MLAICMLTELEAQRMLHDRIAVRSPPRHPDRLLRRRDGRRLRCRDGPRRDRRHCGRHHPSVRHPQRRRRRKTVGRRLRSSGLHLRRGCDSGWLSRVSLPQNATQQLRDEIPAAFQKDTHVGSHTEAPVCSDPRHQSCAVQKQDNSSYVSLTPHQSIRPQHMAADALCPCSVSTILKAVHQV